MRLLFWNSQKILYPFHIKKCDNPINAGNLPKTIIPKQAIKQTGWYYYGARYYNPKTSLWLSVDPLAEKYPGVSSYTYVANNPIKYIDPDGRCYTKNKNGDYIPCAKPIKKITRLGTSITGYSQTDIEYDYSAKKTDSFGYNWTFTKNDKWKLVNTNPNPNYSKKVKISPTGDASYYVKRYIAHIETYGTTPPDYYLSYGYKYAKTFTELRSELSEKGKIWESNTITKLQELMEDFIINSTPKNTKCKCHLQGNSGAFRAKAFDTHVPAYLDKNLLKNLPFGDKFVIGTTPDLKDMFTPDGMRQIKKIIPEIFF